MKLDILRALQDEKKLFGRQQGKTTAFVYHLIGIAKKGFYTEILAVSTSRQLADWSRQLFEDIWLDTNPAMSLLQSRQGQTIISKLPVPITIDFISIRQFKNNTMGLNPGTLVVMDPDILETRLDQWR